MEWGYGNGTDHIPISAFQIKIVMNTLYSTLFRVLENVFK